ncbi:MAG: energy coupling factor transporter S component ThiW [Candidatus Bathyarchaeia archaeon]
MEVNTKRFATTAVFTAIAVILSPFFFPVGPTKCYPAQHLVNAITGVLLGPMWALMQALATSIIRNALGLGTVFAFPGSMFGALFVGLLYWLTGKRYLEAALIEVVGTGIVGALVSWAVFTPIFFPEKVAVLGAVFFITAFSVSSIAGTIIGYIVLQAFKLFGVTHRTFMTKRAE